MPGLRRSSVLLLTASAGWTFFVVYSSLLPPDKVPARPWMARIFFDKWVHFGFYYILVTLYIPTFERLKVKFALSDKSVTLAALSAISIGAAVECIQGVGHIGRHFDILDLIANIMGVSAGVLIYRIITSSKTV